MKHEVILENNVKEYYFKSKLLVRKNSKPTELINIRSNQNYYKKIDFINKTSGIFNSEEELEKYVDNLKLGSFGMWYEIELISPYHSRDDDELYIIQNPILKEHIYKCPMIRGSSWKGFFSSIALNIIKENLEEDQICIKRLFDNYLSFARIFGTGSENYRQLKVEIEKTLENRNDKKIEENLIKYCLYDLGLNINIKKNQISIKKQLLNQIMSDVNEDIIKNIFTIHKGRAIFYPTYFERLNFEVINPHKKTNRKGKNPILFEVVPKGAKGVFQLIYIPYDGILEEQDKVKKETDKDKELLEIIFRELLETKGIGAKTKLGWGRFKIINK